MTATTREDRIADAWVAAANAAEPGLGAVRVRSVADKLGDRVTQAVEAVAKSDRAEPLTKTTWLHRYEIGTAIRIRKASTTAATDTVAALAERLADLPKRLRPLTTLDGYPVTLESIERTLWLPDELEKNGVYAAIVTHTWRVEVDNPEAPSSSSSSSPAP